MTPLLAARRQHLAATLGLHTHAKAVGLGPAALARLICALWQSNPPLSLKNFSEIVLENVSENSFRAIEQFARTACSRALHRLRNRT